MPRPSSPLISHDAVVEASLGIIDREGLDAFSMPRLARELSVQAPSLYHHFQDRADILRTVDGLDTLTLGASLAEAAKSPARAGQVFANVTADAEPMLAEALAVNTRSAEELFADSIRSFLRGAAPEVPPDVPAPRALIVQYRETRTMAASRGRLTDSRPASRPRPARGLGLSRSHPA